MHICKICSTFAPEKDFKKNLRRKHMSCLQVLLALIFPPLAVVDRGCGSFTIVFILTLLGWVPGVIAALIILNKNEK